MVRSFRRQFKPALTIILTCATDAQATITVNLTYRR